MHPTLGQLLLQPIVLDAPPARQSSGGLSTGRSPAPQVVMLPPADNECAASDDPGIPGRPGPTPEGASVGPQFVDLAPNPMGKEPSDVGMDSVCTGVQEAIPHVGDDLLDTIGIDLEIMADHGYFFHVSHALHS